MHGVHLREESKEGGSADDGALLLETSRRKLVFFIRIICLSRLIRFHRVKAYINGQTL